MTLSLEARRRNIHWIKWNAEKKKHNLETAALSDWASEGGSAANTSQVAITMIKGRTRFICYYQRSVPHDNSYHGHQ